MASNNFIVSSASNAFEAKKKLEIIKFDILVLDIMMPGESGLSLTEHVKKNNSTPIILLTAKDEVQNRIKGLELGADDYLSKPFEPKELLLRIKNIVNKNNKIDLSNKYIVGKAEIDLNKLTSNPKCIIIGPEGDFSELERGQILKFKRVQPIKINENILRSETAVISALSIINYIIN